MIKIYNITNFSNTTVLKSQGTTSKDNGKDCQPPICLQERRKISNQISENDKFSSTKLPTYLKSFFPLQIITSWIAIVHMELKNVSTRFQGWQIGHKRENKIVTNTVLFLAKP